VNLAFNADCEVAKSAANLLLARKFLVFVVAEYFRKHILDNSDGVSFRHVPLGDLTDDTLILFEAGREPILHPFGDFHFDPRQVRWRRRVPF